MRLTPIWQAFFDKNYYRSHPLITLLNHRGNRSRSTGETLYVHSRQVHNPTHRARQPPGAIAHQSGLCRVRVSVSKRPIAGGAVN